MTPGENTRQGTVAKVFVATYLAPFVLWIGWGTLSGGWRSISRFNLILTAWMIFLFPSGLLAFVTDSKNLVLLAALGYVVYAVVFGAAFTWRRHWQTLALWAILVVLLMFNAAGCRMVAEGATRNISAP